MNSEKNNKKELLMAVYAGVNFVEIILDREDDEQQIFEKHFGGIYYVYVRGCKAGTGNGIYARSWKSWKELEAAFIKIRDTLIANKE